MTLSRRFYNVDFKEHVSLPKNNENIISKVLNVIRDLEALKVLYDDKLLNETIKEVENFCKNKKNYIVFGTGGSNLGARALIGILQNKIKCNISFYDNIDPISFKNSIDRFDLNNTGFIIVSKSGETPETLAQFASIIEIFDQKKSLFNLYDNSLIITEEKNSSLLKIANSNKCKVLRHPNNIGGRYSIFTNVGMVPAIIAGIDVKKIHEGALKEFNTITSSQDFLKLGQFFKYQNMNDYLSNNVIMTYSDSLYYFGKWYLQLWAESLGKNKKGITPIHSIGTTDQHSQLQMYLDGPRDKFFTFITTNHSGKGFKFNNKILKENKIDFLLNKTMGDLMQAEQKATIETFKKNQFMFREINLSQIDEFALGKLLSFSILETVASCIYFEVNPFDQPAVEEGKILTKKYLS